MRLATRKRQRTVGNRLVACATVPRDILEQCGLAETRTWWRACGPGPILHNNAQCVHHLQLITSCFLELLLQPEPSPLAHRDSESAGILSTDRMQSHDVAAAPTGTQAAASARFRRFLERIVNS
jgi:hypothetical protein